MDELRSISTALLGTVDIVADPAELAADFEAMITSSQARSLPSVSLRLWAPRTRWSSRCARWREVVDLTATATPSGPLARDFLLGGWSPGETRDYHMRIKVTPGGVGEEMLAGRVSLVLADGTIATQALIKATWTDDTELSTRMDRHVAHYTGQEELANAIQEGVAAAKAGDQEDRHGEAGPGGATGRRVRPRRHHAAAAARGGRRRERRDRHRPAQGRRREGGRDDARHPFHPHRPARQAGAAAEPAARPSPRRRQPPGGEQPEARA